MAAGPIPGPMALVSCLFAAGSITDSVEEKEENVWAKTFCTMNSSNLFVEVENCRVCLLCWQCVRPKPLFSLSLRLSFSVASSRFLRSSSGSVSKISTRVRVRFCSEVTTLAPLCNSEACALRASRLSGCSFHLGIRDCYPSLCNIGR